MNIIGEIPARYGSKRVKQKNLRNINGKKLIEYAIEAAMNSELLTDAYVNSESDVIGNIATEKGIKYYKRAESLATDTATSDQFNYDFIKKTNADVLVLINPVSPLIEGEDIDKLIKYFNQNDYDTIISSRDFYTHTYYKDEPLNFDPNAMLPRTQDLNPVQLCVWSLCLWRAETFIAEYEKSGRAVFSGKIGLYPISLLKSVKISYEEDFMLAEALLQYRDGVKQ